MTKVIYFQVRCTHKLRERNLPLTIWIVSDNYDNEELAPRWKLGGIGVVGFVI